METNTRTPSWARVTMIVSIVLAFAGGILTTCCFFAIANPILGREFPQFMRDGQNLLISVAMFVAGLIGYMVVRIAQSIRA